MKQVDLFGTQQRPNPKGGKLAEAFILPPFTVLNAREGWWQERKRAWLALGIKSEIGRGGATQAHNERNGTTAETIGRPSRQAGGGAAPGGSPRPATDYRNGQRGDGRGRPL